MKEFIINKNEEKQRFDKYLKKLLPQATSSFIYKMLRKKNITLNGKKAEGNETLSNGDKVCVFFSDETFEKFSGNDIERNSEYEQLAKLPLGGLEIIFEDRDILIANKPFNMLSQKASVSDISANEYLLGYLIRTNKLSVQEFATFRPSVCNRLDRNTTGLLLMGVSLKGSQDLSAMLKARTIQKYYLTIVAGTITKGAYLKGYLKKDERTNRVMLSTHRTSDDAKIIETAYEPLSSKKQTTLLKVHLITGKTHQIRAHLASIGHPIIGDPKYGNREINQWFRERYNIKAQLLFAYRLEFPDGRAFEAPLPKTFLQVDASYQNDI